MKLDRPLIAIDTETTGTDPTVDRIVQIGVSILHPDGSVNPRGWSRMFNPGIPIPAAATSIHGITDEMVKDCKPFSSVAPSLCAKMAGMDILTYNGRRLDLPILDEEYRRCGLKLDLTGVRVLDAQAIYFKREPRSLADAVRRYCKREPSKEHDAGGDATDTLDAFLGQISEYGDLAAMPLDELAAYATLGDNPPVDLAGKLYRDKEGFVCYAFGKSKDKRVADDLGYANWMLSKGFFPGSTLDCLREELDRLAAL